MLMGQTVGQMDEFVKTYVCGPHLQASAAEEVDQTSAVCKKKTVCFLTSADYEEEMQLRSPGVCRRLVDRRRAGILVLNSAATVLKAAARVSTSAVEQGQKIVEQRQRRRRSRVEQKADGRRYCSLFKVDDFR
ncbi:hypothetical protein LXL04_038863 [Taraxacum kok-saghyz]